MKISNIVLSTVFIRFAGGAFAFATRTSNPVSVANRSIVNIVSKQKENGNRSNSALKMNFFSNLFGGARSSLYPKIVYEDLDFPGNEMGKMAKDGIVVNNSLKYPKLKAATFAGGCFWGLELAFQRVPGVVYTATGYTQGQEKEPTYREVCAGATTHTEAVCVYYDESECSYDDLLNTFFDRVDPTTVNGQGRDFGFQYRTGVYTHSTEQMKSAKSKFEEVKSQYKKKIATELQEADLFWPAEKYHQQYLEKGGRFGEPQSAEKGATETIRCYG